MSDHMVRARRLAFVWPFSSFWTHERKHLKVLFLLGVATGVIRRKWSFSSHKLRDGFIRGHADESLWKMLSPIWQGVGASVPLCLITATTVRGFVNNGPRVKVAHCSTQQSQR